MDTDVPWLARSSDRWTLDVTRTPRIPNFGPHFRHFLCACENDQWTPPTPLSGPLGVFQSRPNIVKWRRVLQVKPNVDRDWQAALSCPPARGTCTPTADPTRPASFVTSPYTSYLQEPGLCLPGYKHTCPPGIHYTALPSCVSPKPALLPGVQMSIQMYFPFSHPVCS